MRYLRFERWLDETRKIAGGIDAVYFEEVRRHAGTDAAHVYGGFLATLTAWCEAQSIPYQGVPVGTIKRFATGKGNADKQAMIAAMRERGFEPADDNEADAIAILLWAIETKGGVHEQPGRDVPQARRQCRRRATCTVRRSQHCHGGPRRTLVGDTGPAVTPAQVVLCLIDLKLARLAHDPSHEDSAVDVCGYAALLRELIETSTSEGR